MRPRTRKTGTALAAAALSLTVAACSSSSDTATASQASADGITQLKVGTSPTISNASLYLGTQDGTYEKNGLSVTPQVIQSGAQAIPQLLNGQIQFAAADPLGSMLAISAKTPLKLVASGNVVASDVSRDPSGLIAKADGPVRTLADLEGRTVAVNATKSLGQVGLQAAIDAKGGDSSKVKFVEVAFPQMVAAVQAGTVDAAATSEPFVSAARAAGLVTVPSGGLSTTLSGVPQVVYLTSASYAEKNPDVVQRFAESVTAANAALGKDPERIREVGATSTSIPPEALSKITLPTFGPGLSLAKLQQLEQTMVRYDVLPAPIPDLAKHVVGAGSG